MKHIWENQSLTSIFGLERTLWTCVNCGSKTYTLSGRLPDPFMKVVIGHSSSSDIYPGVARFGLCGDKTVFEIMED